MVWPPTTHQEAQDEISPLRLAHRDYYRPGYYSTGMFSAVAFGTAALTVDVIYLRPFWVMARRTFDRVGINVTTATAAGSGGVLQLGVYEPGAGLPGNPVYQSGNVSTETTGSKEGTLALTLDPGIWWVGVRAQVAAPTVTTAGTNVSNPWVSTQTLVPQAANTQIGLSVTSAAATWPTTGFASQSTQPLVALRAA